MLRFGLPTMPAELTLYSLSFIDRIIIVRLAGLAEAGLYALAVKFANGMQVLVRGFHLAWPPLAYSIQDDDEARRAYALIVSWFVAIGRVRGGRPLAPGAVARPAPGRRALLRGTGGRRPARRRDGALRAVPGAGRDPRPDGPHRALVSGDARRGRRQRRPQPHAGARVRDHRRRRRTGGVLRRRRGDHVRDRPPALLRAVRVAPPLAGGRPRRSADRGRRDACAPRRSVGARADARALRRLSRRPVGSAVPDRGGARALAGAVRCACAESCQSARWTSARPGPSRRSTRPHGTRIEGATSGPPLYVLEAPPRGYLDSRSSPGGAFSQSHAAPICSKPSGS